MRNSSSTGSGFGWMVMTGKVVVEVVEVTVGSGNGTKGAIVIFFLKQGIQERWWWRV